MRIHILTVCSGRAASFYYCLWRPGCERLGIPIKVAKL